MKQMRMLTGIVALAVLICAPGGVLAGTKRQKPAAQAEDPNQSLGKKTTGEVVNLGADKITIRDSSGKEAVYAINSATKFGKDGALSLPDFKTDSKVVVIYMEISGVLTARQIMPVIAEQKPAQRGRGRGSLRLR